MTANQPRLTFHYLTAPYTQRSPCYPGSFSSTCSQRSLLAVGAASMGGSGSHPPGRAGRDSPGRFQRRLHLPDRSPSGRRAAPQQGGLCHPCVCHLPLAFAILVPSVHRKGEAARSLEILRGLRGAAPGGRALATRGAFQILRKGFSIPRKATAPAETAEGGRTAHRRTRDCCRQQSLPIAYHLLGGWCGT